ncbi:MAG TPA: NUDIX domain-containing protein, partial [Planctomycetaceae bacterium]|nr:NUDIX domain-containing protein [Planctomycetaceae bacterium]
MRQSAAALALICREEHGRGLWLARWNARWEAYAFVGGHKRPEETFRQCLVRELGEELGLRDGEFTVRGAAPVRLEYSAWSKSAGEATAYVIELFDVEVGDTSQPRIAADRRNRWLTR